MSLQVWLPLNGNLENKGLSSVTVTNSGATVNSAGKIGNCYQFNGSNQKILATFPSSISTAVGSLACWVKFNALPASNGWMNLMQLGAAGGFAACCLGMYFEYGTGINISINGSSTNQNYKAYSFTTGVWYHICATYDGISVKLYINGIEQLNKTAVVGSYTTAAATLFMGGTSAYQLNGYMNDCRYYDHALSAKEVEEISKGLVLHYQLDDLYSEATINLCSQLGQGGQMTLANNILTHNGTNSDTYWYIKPKEALVGGATYTVSCYLSGFALDTDWISWGVGAQSGDNNAGYWKTYNGYNSFTFTMPAGKDGSTANFIFDDNNPGTGRSQVFTISNVQLELKDHATPFVEYGQSRSATTIYDSSGYNNNGTITGSLAVITGSPKFDRATSLTTTSTHINTILPSVSGFSDSYSIAWWGNVSSYGSKMMWGFSNGNRLNGIYNGNLWNTGDGTSNPLYAPGTTTQVTAPTVNVWHHFVMIGNGTSCLVYKDGELWGQAKTYKQLTGTNLWFNGWDNTTTYALANTKISDFHIYATALTAAQVQELYRTSLLVDSSGNMTPRGNS